MLYINKADIKKMVTINMLGRFVAPGEVVDLAPRDVNMLGANAIFVVPVEQVKIEQTIAEPIQQPIEPKPPEIEKKIEKPKKEEKKVEKPKKEEKKVEKPKKEEKKIIQKLKHKNR